MIAPLLWTPLAREGAVGALRDYGSGVAAAAFVLVLLAISVHDVRTGVIPLRYTLGGSAMALVWSALRMSPAAAGARVVAAAFAALGLWWLARCIGLVAGREVMGEGDALLLGFLTLAVGPARVGTLLAAAATLALAVIAARLLPRPWRAPAMWAAALLAAGAFVAGGWARVAALALPLAVAWPRRERAAEPLPFGPMLAAGAALSLLTPAPSLPWLPHAAALGAPLFRVPCDEAPAHPLHPGGPAGEPRVGAAPRWNPAPPPPWAEPPSPERWGSGARELCATSTPARARADGILATSRRGGSGGFGSSASLRLMDVVR